ncbi:hypothetical protein SAMN05446037_102815 [Anaerovirgula multivorans]|uniref:Uncharacterized protein n=1 Tax=Anaerovirgula multivorans TaxID=312168 RepID=A0A239IHJ5_9FIRM|nr:hypothetical protein SAMN05446037_102815 [Anaerovirgula multivorans]
MSNINLLLLAVQSISAAEEEQVASLEIIASSSKDLQLIAEALNREISKFKIQ